MNPTIMQAILLLDTHCGPCSEIGRQIAAEGLLDDSRVVLGSLHDEVLRKRVHDVHLDAKWEPMLLKEDGESRTVVSGLRLAVELTAMLGIRRSIRLSQLIRETMKREGVDSSRRSFLIKFATAAAVVPILGVGAIAPQVASAKDHDDVEPEEEVEVDPLTRSEVVLAYHTVLSSATFGRVRRAAYQNEQLLHARDRSIPAALENQPLVFKADTYGAYLVPGTGRDRRAITLILTYTTRSGDLAEARYIRAVVTGTNPRRRRMASLVDVDATSIETGTVKGSGPRGEPAQEYPAGTLKFTNGTLSTTITDGKWSGDIPNAAAVGTRDPCAAQWVCVVVAVSVCALECAIIAAVPFLGIIGGAICSLVCGLSFGITCLYIEC